jgi:septum formation protein
MTDRFLILASASPRRQDLLKEAGFELTVEPANVKELFTPDLAPADLAMHNAELKARAIAETLDSDAIVLGADTVVALDGQVYGKPLSRDDASETLQKLSDRTHEVITGVCLISTEQEVTFHETTSVTFHALQQVDIDRYIDGFKPFDKAGAYAIQEWIGLIGVKEINGNYENVVGLPVARVVQELAKFK